ncbi:hypothetical protein AA3271_1615 [Gluconobacter japonicus NBRC 3271]|nr:hypothetical protein AA3271_1615 [Gluconobacter japonicus NBRC 3271]
MNKERSGFPNTRDTVQTFLSEWEKKTEFCGTFMNVIELFDTKELAEKRLRKTIWCRRRLFLICNLHFDQRGM